MRKLLPILVITFFTRISEGQGVIDMFRASTVSIGQTQLSIDANHHLSKKFLLRGTGVLFYLKNSKVTIPCIITAKHVVYYPKQNWYPKELQIRFDDDDTLSFKEYTGLKINIKSGNYLRWYCLPDSNVDLACIPLIPGDNMDIHDTDILKKSPVLPYNSIASNSDIFDGESIMVLGYPGFATENILVKSILRQGIISWTNPRKNINSTYLIDCNVFPGNSGGPVFIMPYGLGKADLKAGGKPMFGGIVTEVYFEQQNATDSTTQNNMHNFQNKQIFVEQKTALGVVEPATRVRELLEFVSAHIED